MAYKRVDAVPCAKISFEGMKLFRYVPANEKGIVWDAVLEYFTSARQKGAGQTRPDPPANLSDIGRDAYDGLISHIDEGITSYWNTCKRNAHNRSTIGNDTSTNDDQVVNQQENKQISSLLGCVSK